MSTSPIKERVDSKGDDRGLKARNSTSVEAISKSTPESAHEPGAEPQDDSREKGDTVYVNGHPVIHDGKIDSPPSNI